MAFDKSNLAPSQTARSSDVLQIINALDGTANYGQPITLNKLNSNAAYALDVQNLGTGGGLRVKSTAGATLLDVTDSGVSYTLAAITVPSSAGAAPTGEGVMEWDSDDDLLKVGTGAATKVMVDTNSTQTLTNKTLTAPTMSTVTVSAGGLMVTAGGATIKIAAVGQENGLSLTNTDATQTSSVALGFNPNTTANADVVRLRGFVGNALNNGGGLDFQTRNGGDGSYTTAMRLLDSPNGQGALRVYGTLSLGAATTASGDLRQITLSEGETLTVTGGTGNIMGVHAGSDLTITSGGAHGRFAQFYAQAGTITLTSGTLANANALYCETPSGATTNKTIDTNSGAGTSAHLTTGGVWTDAASWAAHKTAIREVDRAEVAGLLDWLRDHHQPITYRYPTVRDAQGRIVSGGDQPTEHDHFGYRLEDFQHDPVGRRLFEIVTSSPEGAISGKDERGLLLSLVQECARRIAALAEKGAN